MSPQKAASGSKVTITPKPDAGCRVDQVTVTDKNGKAVAVTDSGSGSWSFTMPAGGASVSVSFTEGGGSQGTTGGFTDVPGWCADAVDWAVENGITKGTTETTFSPNDPCVRSQIVTFLYRFFKKG